MRKTGKKHGLFARRAAALLLVIMLAVTLVPLNAMATSSVTFKTVTDPTDKYFGLPLFSGNPADLEAYLEVYFNYIGFDGIVKYALDQRNDYQLRDTATFAATLTDSAALNLLLGGKTISWVQPNAGRWIPGCANFTEGINMAAGMGTGYTATQFGNANSWAQTWNKQLNHDIGEVIGRERVNNVQYAGGSNTGAANSYMSNINIMHSIVTDIRALPTTGRGDTDMGEDPMLSGTLMDIAAQGITGLDAANNPDGFFNRVFVEAKHFAGYTSMLYGSHGNSGGSNTLGARALTEYSAASSIKGFRSGSISGFMATYSRNNHIPGVINPVYQYAQNESRFGIYTLSDNGAERHAQTSTTFGNGFERSYFTSRLDQIIGHFSARNSAGHQQATTNGNNAGTDTNFGAPNRPITGAIGENHMAVIWAVQNGRMGLTLDQLKEIARSQIMYLIRAGILNERDENGMPMNYPFSDEIWNPNGEAARSSKYNSSVREHAEVALKNAQESVVLLRNDNNLLPISTDTDIVVTGWLANTRLASGSGHNNGVAANGIEPHIPGGGLSILSGIAFAREDDVTTSEAARAKATEYMSAASDVYVVGEKAIIIKASNGKYLRASTATGFPVIADAETSAEATKFQVQGQSESMSLTFQIVGETDDRTSLNGRYLQGGGTTGTSAAHFGRQWVDYAAGTANIMGGLSASVPNVMHSSWGSFTYLQLTDGETGALGSVGIGIGANAGYSGAALDNMKANQQRPETVFTIETGIAPAADIGTDKDVAIVVVGYTMSAGNANDRTCIDLGWEQYDLVDAVAAKYPGETIVVVNTNYVVNLERIKANPNVGAVVLRGNGGAYDGLALGQVIYGEVNPSGRMTRTWYGGTETFPKVTKYSVPEGMLEANVAGTGSRWITGLETSPINQADTTIGDPAQARITYMYDDGVNVVYPFGYGLSYGQETVSYRDLSAPKHYDVGKGEPLTIQFGLASEQNQAFLDGTYEVPQVYFRNLDNIYGEATPYRLVGFTKHLMEDEDSGNDANQIAIAIDPRDLELWDVNSNKMSVFNGDYEFVIGRSALDKQFSAVVTITGGDDLAILESDTPLDIYASSFDTQGTVTREVSKQGTLDSLQNRNVTTGYFAMMSAVEGAYTAMKNVDMTNAKSLTMSVASFEGDGNIEVRVGSPTGALLATVAVPKTGTLFGDDYVTYTMRDSNATEDYDGRVVQELGYVDVTVDFSDSFEDGVYDLYLVFTAPALRTATLKVNTEEPVTELNVSVSTPTIVATLGAYLNITVSGDVTDGLTAYLMVGDDKLYPAAISAGKGRMYINAAPEAGPYKLIVEGENAYGECDINVVAYNTDIWSANAYILDGKLQIKFNDDVALKSAKCVTIGGSAYNAAVLTDKRTVEVLGYNAESGAVVKISGVKYPVLFPSYSFTFTVQVP